MNDKIPNENSNKASNKTSNRSLNLSRRYSRLALVQIMYLVAIRGIHISKAIEELKNLIDDENNIANSMISDAEKISDVEQNPIDQGENYDSSKNDILGSDNPGDDMPGDDMAEEEEPQESMKNEKKLLVYNTNEEYFNKLVENLTDIYKNDERISKFLPKDAYVNLLTMSIIRGACHEMDTDSVEYNVVVNEYVEIAKSFFNSQKQVKFVNAVLDNFRKNNFDE